MSQIADGTPDVFPTLNEDFARLVQERLNKRFKKKAPQIAWDDWLRLKPHLAAYKRDAEDVQGYLNKGDVAKLHTISKRAAALLEAISQAEQANLGKPIASVLLEPGMEIYSDDVREPFPDELERSLIYDFQRLLGRIEKELSLKSKPAPYTLELSRASLFSIFEAWWTQTTGLPAEIVEGWAGNTHSTLFMFVANEIFNMPGMPVTIGASSKSLKNLKRSDRMRFKPEHALGEKLKKLGLLE